VPFVVFPLATRLGGPGHTSQSKIDRLATNLGVRSSNLFGRANNILILRKIMN
jgi:hypothetical protein